jgi:integrase
VTRKQGTVVQRQWKSGKGFALRFSAYGERRYVTLGLAADGWTRGAAEEELDNIMADVRRGIWTPPQRNVVAKVEPSDDDAVDGEDPLVHEFAEQWLQSRRGEVSDSTMDFYGWGLSHLLPFFGSWRLSDIDIPAVDRYRADKVKEAERRRRALGRGRPELDAQKRPLPPLSPGSINKTIDILQAILALALEYDKIERNPASGRRRRLKPAAKPPVHLNTADQISALLQAAEELDREPRQRIRDRKGNVATLVFAGARAGEECGLRWRDIDFTNNRIQIRKSKTQAGLREIDLLPILHGDLQLHRDRTKRRDPADLVFATNRGTMRDKDNLRNRVLAPVLKRADDILIAHGHPPLPAGVTPHKLRHTFASVLVACGEDPASVTSQLGHTDPAFTLRVYTHLMRRDPAEREKLKALVSTNPTNPTNNT